jgi:hypothetical protein
MIIVKLLELVNNKINYLSSVFKICALIFVITFYGCETKTGDSGSSTTTTTTSYDTYTSAEINQISTNMGTNMLNLEDLESKGLTSSDYTYLEANIISLLSTIVNEVYTGSVPTTRTTEVDSAVTVEIARLGMISNSEMTVVRGQVNSAISAYVTYDLTENERDQLIGIRSNIDDMQTTITYNENLNPYFVELYNLYIAYYKEPDYNLNDNESLLTSIGISLSNVGIEDTIEDKIALIEEELEELDEWAIVENGYPDTLTDELKTSLNALKTVYEAYTLGGESAIATAESQFRAADSTLLDSYINLDNLSGNQELAYCNDMYDKLKGLSSSSYTDYVNEYNRVYTVLEDFEKKRNAYYGGDDAGEEDYGDTTGNFLICVSTSVNIISTYQYLKANPYPFMD